MLDRWNQRPPYYVLSDGTVLVKHSTYTGLAYEYRREWLRWLSHRIRQGYAKLTPAQRQALAKRKAAYRKDKAKAAYCDAAGRAAMQDPVVRKKHREAMLRHHYVLRCQKVLAARGIRPPWQPRRQLHHLQPNVDN